MKRAPNFKTAVGQDTLSKVFRAWIDNPAATARDISAQTGVRLATVAARLSNIRKSDGTLDHARLLTNKAGEIAAARRRLKLASKPDRKEYYTQQLEKLIAERNANDQPKAVETMQPEIDTEPTNFQKLPNQ